MIRLFCSAFIGSLLLLGVIFAACGQGQPPVKKDAPAVKPIADALKSVIQGKAKTNEASKIADSIQLLADKDELSKGIKPRYDDDVVLFAVEAKKGVPIVAIEIAGKNQELPMTKLGRTNVYAAVYRTEGGEPGLPTGISLSWKYMLDDAPLGSGKMENYQIDPDTIEHSAVPKGKLSQQPKWMSKIFENTERDWWVYVPSQFSADKPACVMIFQDGGGYKDIVSTTFDNLIAKGEMPVTVGIFIQPGNPVAGTPNVHGNQRSFEYDTLSDQYARFLLEEILPEVEKTVKLKHDAASRAVAGLSSGGICAFTVAWERPNEFSKVLSWIGSFTNIASGPTVRAGGHNYEAMIRKTPPKPIRVFLQDGRSDLDNNNGNWPLANQSMAKSLAFAHYDYKFIFGYGTHSPSHGRAMLPNSLRWLWRDYPK